MYCKLLSFIYIFDKQNKRKKMKRHTLLLLAIIISATAFAAKGDADKIYKKLKSETDAFSMSFSKDMIDFFDMDIDFNGKEKWITGDFSEGRMLVVKETYSGSDIRKMFQEEGFELIEIDDEAEINSKQGSVNLFVSRNGSKVSEAHFVIENEDKTVLFSVYGAMKVSKQK